MSSININKVSVEFGDWATPRYDGEYTRISSGFAKLELDTLFAEISHLANNR